MKTKPDFQFEKFLNIGFIQTVLDQELAWFSPSKNRWNVPMSPVAEHKMWQEIKQGFVDLLTKEMEKRYAFINVPKTIWVNGEDQDEKLNVTREVPNFYVLEYNNGKILNTEKMPCKPAYSYMMDELKEELDKIVDRTKKGGGELVNLMGTSAWYAPGAAAAQMVEAIVDDQNRIFPVCALLQGEYGLKDVYLGVPVKLGRRGIEEIIEVDLNKEEKKLLYDSSDSVKGVMKVLDDMKLF